MKKIILVHGMKRSGNHAIINWLLAHDSFIFLNNVIPISAILKGRKTIPTDEEFDSWFQRTISESRHAEANNRYSADSSLLISLEDHALEVLPFKNPPVEIVNVLILRDPSNMFSSRIRKSKLVAKHPAYPSEMGPEMERVIEMWKRHAREYLGITDQLNNKVGIYFNSWFSNQSYRQHILSALGFDPVEFDLSKLATFGGGSSFDPNHSNATAVDVLNRRDLLGKGERELLVDILSDKEIAGLASEIEATKFHMG